MIAGLMHCLALLDTFVGTSSMDGWKGFNRCLGWERVITRLGVSIFA